MSVVTCQHCIMWRNTVRHPCISILKATKQKFAELFQTLWISSAVIEWNQLLNKQEISLPPLLEHSQPSLFKEPCCRRVPLHHFGCSHTHTHFTPGESLIFMSTCSEPCVHGTHCVEELTRRWAVRSGIAVLYLCLKIYIWEGEGIIHFMSTVLSLCARVALSGLASWRSAWLWAGACVALLCECVRRRVYAHAAQPWGGIDT